MKYKKIKIYRAIYTKVLFYGTLSYLAVSTYGVMNTTNNNIYFPGLINVSEDEI